MKRGLKARREGLAFVGSWSSNRCPDEKGTESHDRGTLQGGVSVATVAPMKRGLKELVSLLMLYHLML